ncbi:hypothetical protein QEH68_06690 [Paenarthrobacter sp. OM7]|uniref:hypothetical protein n=1 Tax=Paenarthrobacter sp. OM7 TaxID=3041264 RepID=UPI0024699D65|nr:hypothetical protein [Paenarthrobacter sp. OM7]WGM21855.1 hypothetical protein QEH68_06690 [Paenarthrobacter sp. OM7]
MPEVPSAVVAHDELSRRLGLLALTAGRSAWRRIAAGDIGGSWDNAVTGLAVAMAQLQLEAATSASTYSAEALAEQGMYQAPSAFIDPAAFAGVAPDGRSLESLLYSPVTKVKEYIAKGVEPARALQIGRSHLDIITRTVVADTGRAAASVDIAVRKGIGYTRMLVPPSCSRCAVLAGRFYRWNAGFNRHPRCDCKHIPSREDVAEDLTTDPYEYFRSLPPDQQEKQFGKAEAKAINDGADIYQVVNARRGMKPGGVTTEGTSRQGNFRSSSGQQRRLTPEAIYERAGSREEALKLLERNGYVLPGGQQPGGVIRGDREGFGQMGRGGTRVGARESILSAREAGTRDPGNRATMTAAERRAFDAQANWDAVKAGRNPYGRGKLTPELAAAVENDFRNIILNGDAVAKLTARRSMAPTK